MPYKNLTITPPKHGFDGFGSQYLKKLTGYAYCIAAGSKRYRYIHTPFIMIDQIPQDQVSAMNEFIGIPDNRHGKKIHVSYPCIYSVYPNIDYFFSVNFLNIIRNCYWSTPKPKPCAEEIVVHIRRGDLHLRYKRPRDEKVWHHNRMENNDYYNTRVLNILKQHPNDNIVIHSEGELSEFETITNEWQEEYKNRVRFALNEDVKKTFHDMVCAKKLFLARSSFSYVAGLLCEGDIFHQNGVCNEQTRQPRSFWKNWSIYD